MKREDTDVIIIKAKEDRRDRRAPTKPRLTIQQIIENMETQADLEYQGNLSDNMLKIFNDLSTDDKRTFLRYSMKIVWEKRIELAKHGMEDIIVDQDMRIDPSAVAAELEVIGERDHEEQMALRSFLLKTALVVSVVMFLGIFFWAYVHGSVTTEADGLMSIAEKIINILLDNSK